MPLCLNRPPSQFSASARVRCCSVASGAAPEASISFTFSLSWAWAKAARRFKKENEMKYVSLLGIAAVTVLGTDLGAAQAAFAPNKVVINDVTLTDTAASQQIFTVNPTNGQSVQ